MQNLKMLGSNLLIKRTNTAAVTSSVLVLPETTKRFGSVVCEVLAVGPGETLDCGVTEDMQGLKPGDKVIVWPGIEIAELPDNLYIVDITHVEARCDNE